MIVIKIIALLFCIVITSLFGLRKGVAWLLLCLGIQEFLRAKWYYDNKKKKWAIGTFAVGFLGCIFGFLVLINVI